MRLNSRESAIVAGCINNYGGGAHPFASEENAEQFTPQYIARCVKAALAADAMTPEGAQIARSVLAKAGS